MYNNVFSQAGLTATQAEILEFLLKNGLNKAITVSKELKKPRGVIYRSLDELLEFNLIEKIEKTGKIAVFRATHPSNLEKMFEEKEKELSKNKSSFFASLPNLISTYNLSADKPGVLFFEGEEGLRRVLDDTLTSKTEILLFLDKQSLLDEDAFFDINEEYKIKREKNGLKKKIIRFGSAPVNYKSATGPSEYEKITQIRYYNKSTLQFKASIQIYDNKISYQIFNGGRILSFIIENAHIYEMNRAWFESMWENCE